MQIPKFISKIISILQHLHQEQTMISTKQLQYFAVQLHIRLLLNGPLVPRTMLNLFINRLKYRIIKTTNRKFWQ